MSVLQLIYYSESSLSVRKRRADLEHILSSAIKNNTAAGITGVLIFDDMWFVQVLEGSPDAVKSTFEHITQDNRHANVKLLQKKQVAERHFPDWAMGLAVRTAENEHIFKQRWIDEGMKPTAVAPAALLELMDELIKAGAMWLSVPEAVY
jgi:hypothetical protein